MPGNIYTRIMNPTWDVFEQRVAALQGGIAAFAPASGQAAVTYSVLNITRAGDNIISVSTLYGGTYNLFAHTLPQYGIEVRFADADGPDSVAALTDENTRLVFAETIGNPKLNVVDIAAWAEAAHAQGLPLIVDNTVPTPLGCRRLRARRRHRGALGHEVHRRPRHVDRRRPRRRRQVRLGRQRRAVPGPDEARPVLPRRRLGRRARAGRLHRPRAHRAAAQHRRGAVAVQRLPVPPGPRDAAAAHGAALRERRWRSRGTSRATRRSSGSTTRASSSPYHDVAKRQLSGGFGGLVTFGIEGGREAGKTFIESLELFSHLANIGDAKSLAIHNATTTHSQLNDEELEAAGVTQDTVRLSVGIEHIDDILDDIDQALAKTRVPVTA